MKGQTDFLYRARFLIFSGINDEVSGNDIFFDIIFIIFTKDYEVYIWLDFPDLRNSIVCCINYIFELHFFGLFFGYFLKVQVRELCCLFLVLKVEPNLRLIIAGFRYTFRFEMIIPFTNYFCFFSP